MLKYRSRWRKIYAIIHILYLPAFHVLFNSKSLAFGKWFMRTFLNSVLDINDLANHMANDSKIERTLVANINSAITRQIVELLCNGHPIRILHIGLLKLGVNSKGESTVRESLL